MSVAIGWTPSAWVFHPHYDKRPRPCIKDSGFSNDYWVTTKVLYIKKNWRQFLEHSRSSIYMFGYKRIIFGIMGNFLFFCRGGKITKVCEATTVSLIHLPLEEVELGCPKPSWTQNVQNKLISFLSKPKFPFNLFRIFNIMATPNSKMQHSHGVWGGEVWKGLRELKYVEYIFLIQKINIE